MILGLAKMLQGEEKEESGLKDMMAELKKNPEIEAKSEEGSEDLDLDILDDGDNAFAQDIDFGNLDEDVGKSDEGLKGQQNQGNMSPSKYGIFGKAGSLFGNLNNFNVFGSQDKQKIMKENEINLIKKEIEYMNREYPKHPDFVKRIQSVIEDNYRLRILLENQNCISEEKYSNIILSQFLHFYDHFIKLRAELFNQKSAIADLLKKKDEEIDEIKSRTSKEIERLNSQFNQSIEKTKELKLQSIKNNSRQKSMQVMRILETMKAGIDDISERLEETKEEISDFKSEYQVESRIIKNDMKRLKTVKIKFKSIMKKLTKSIINGQILEAKGPNQPQILDIQDKTEEGRAEEVEEKVQTENEESSEDLDIDLGDPWGDNQVLDSEEKSEDESKNIDKKSQSDNIFESLINSKEKINKKTASRKPKKLKEFNFSNRTKLKPKNPQ